VCMADLEKEKGGERDAMAFLNFFGPERILLSNWRMRKRERDRIAVVRAKKSRRKGSGCDGRIIVRHLARLKEKKGRRSVDAYFQTKRRGAGTARVGFDRQVRKGGGGETKGVDRAAHKKKKKKLSRLRHFWKEKGGGKSNCFTVQSNAGEICFASAMKGGEKRKGGITLAIRMEVGKKGKKARFDC